MAELAKQLGSAGEQVGGEAAGEIGKELGQIAQWLTETLNQWKLKLLATIIGIPILFLLMNVQFVLVRLVGLKIPKLLPEMPWWELLILGIVDMMVFLATLIFISPIIIVAGVGCTLPVLNWFAC